MARLFISHSSRDNFEALAFKQWLTAEDWAAEDVFLDLHGIGAGARCKEALAKANQRAKTAPPQGVARRRVPSSRRN